MNVTPRDWQAIAQREASELLGTLEGAAKLAEAKRYGVLADQIGLLYATLCSARDAIRYPWPFPADMLKEIDKVLAETAATE